MNMLGDDQMSDYYGSATLESWLSEEVFETSSDIPADVVALFEKWRSRVESDIQSWMDTDHGDGRRSWRGWGRGFNAIPDAESNEFDAAEQLGREMMQQ